jgi:predicted acetyltransferase
MLAAALPIAAGHGIDTATLICSEDNAGARKVIEANGKQFDRVAHDRCWFQLTTSRLVHS